jgi:hypothetical protein
MPHRCIRPRCSSDCTGCNEAVPEDRANLDDLIRLRDDAMAAGPGSGKWINEAQASMDAELAQLRLAEEGAKEAFGHVVEAKQALERKCRHLQVLLDAAYADIRRLRLKA